MLKAKKWEFYKKCFSVDKVILVGQLTDFYKVYCINSSKEEAIRFDIKSSNDLNDTLISTIDAKNIYVGNLTHQVSVDKAVFLLENCTYDTPSVIKPNKQVLEEVIDFLKLNITK